MTSNAKFFSLGIFNAGLLNIGHNDFNIAMDQYGPDLLFVNGTWIAANQTVCAPSPPGFA